MFFHVGLSQTHSLTREQINSEHIAHQQSALEASHMRLQHLIKLLITCFQDSSWNIYLYTTSIIICIFEK